MISISPNLNPVAQTGPQLFCQLLNAGLDSDSMSAVRRAVWLGANQTASLLRGSGKPFACHLIGVASLLAEVRLESPFIISGLLHAIYQDRVPFGPGPIEQRRQVLREQYGAEVEGLVWAYNAAGPLQPQADMLSLDENLAKVRIMQLADELEDALDGAPWLHGNADDSGAERGCAVQRVQHIRSLEMLYAQTSSIGAGTLLIRYRAVMDSWQRCEWPNQLRGGAYTSVSATPMGNTV